MELDAMTLFFWMLSLSQQEALNSHNFIIHTYHNIVEKVNYRMNM